MKRSYLAKRKLPDSPGVYFFKKSREMLYIGKATSLRDRVKSYFGNELMHARGPLLVDMVTQATSLSFQRTDSVLEAFLLETELIKKHQPRYNTKEKDNKSFNHVVITDEAFPRVLTVRGRALDAGIYKYTFGPYPYGNELREALRLVRKIFPYRDACIPCAEQLRKKSGSAAPKASGVCKPCFNRSIGLCPGVCTGEISQKDYARQVRHIRLFFEGKKKQLLVLLTREMKENSKKLQFERAGEIWREIQALAHIQDVSMLKADHVGAAAAAPTSSSPRRPCPFRIEAYDIAHLGGKDMVGAMAVMTGGEFDKSQYRKFVIRTVDGSNDTAALAEMLERRLKHGEWKPPDLVVMDGGHPQRAVAEHAFAALDPLPMIVSVRKDDRHKAKEVLGIDSENVKKAIKAGVMDPRDIVRINAECHRYAITFHKKRRKRSFL